MVERFDQVLPSAQNFNVTCERKPDEFFEERIAKLFVGLIT
jgi:hypothetical protein